MAPSAQEMWFQSNKINPSPPGGSSIYPLNSARPHRTYTQTTITRLKKPPLSFRQSYDDANYRHHNHLDDDSSSSTTMMKNNSTISSMFMCSSEPNASGGAAHRATTPLQRPTRLAPLLTASASPLFQSQSSGQTRTVLTRHRIAPLPPVQPATNNQQQQQQHIMTILPKPEPPKQAIVVRSKRNIKKTNAVGVAKDDMVYQMKNIHYINKLIHFYFFVSLFCKLLVTWGPSNHSHPN